MYNCIWCGIENSDKAEEHIIPEALGCPDGFILTDGVVCESCNNKLAHLDRAVIDDFDLFIYMTGVPRKRGRRPEICSRGNLLGTWDNSGRIISVNMENFPVVGPDGKRINARGKSKRNINATFKRAGNLGEISFATTIGEDPKFVRGIIKIAFSSLAYFLGAQALRDNKYDSIRTYVTEGKGTRKIIILPSFDSAYKNEACPPYQARSGEYAIAFRLATIEFNVDLTSDMSVFPILKNKAQELYGKDGWGYLPL